MHPSRGIVIYLLGIPGCGKLTIAHEIAQRLDCIIIDSHYINNVIFRLIDPDGITRLPPKVWEQTAKVRAAVLETVQELSKPGRNFVFTNALFEGVERHQRAFEEVRSVANALDARFIPVRLSILPEEAARRTVSPGRAEALKDINPDEARRAASEAKILRPKEMATLELEVSTLTAQQAAERILAYVCATDA